MFNLSTLSGINLKTDNYFQYTSNAREFHLKRKCIRSKMHLRFIVNVKAFWSNRKDVLKKAFMGSEKLIVSGPK